MTTTSRLGPYLRRLLLAAPLCAGCEQLKEVDDGGDDGEIPAAVQRAFTETCATGGCHSKADQAGFLSLAPGDAAAILDTPSRQVPSLPLVEIGDTAGSYLAIKMMADEDLPDGVMRENGRMPASGDFANPNNATILAWIAGAELPDEDTDTGEDLVRLCGIRDLMPGAPSTIDFGDEAGKIPTAPGLVLRDNCGCHQLTVEEQADLQPGDRPGMTFFDTWEQVQAEIGRDADDNPIFMWERIKLRAVDSIESDFPMPPLTCREQEIGTLLMDDYEVLRAWLEAGAPDGADWPPP